VEYVWYVFFNETTNVGSTIYVPEVYILHV